MIFEEEPRPKPRERFQPALLADWSEADLRAYIADLGEEIGRAHV